MTKLKACLDKITYSIEIAISVFLILVVLIGVVEVIFDLLGFPITILVLDFERVLCIALAFVICIEFVKMLYKHTPETVIDVLLFAIARQIVVYHENTIDMLIGVAAIVGLFAAKKFMLGQDLNKD